MHDNKPVSGTHFHVNGFAKSRSHTEAKGNSEIVAYYCLEHFGETMKKETRKNLSIKMDQYIISASNIKTMCLAKPTRSELSYRFSQA